MFLTPMSSLAESPFLLALERGGKDACLIRCGVLIRFCFNAVLFIFSFNNCRLRTASRLHFLCPSVAVFCGDQRLLCTRVCRRLVRRSSQPATMDRLDDLRVVRN